MTQLKNTPGPWFIHDELGYAVATIAKTRIAAKVAPDKDLMPDARLIAAAPELLEALQAVVDAAGPDAGPAIGMALAAIAKATNHE